MSDPHKYIVNLTYEVVDEESAQEGEAKEHGFEEENKKYDSLRDLIDAYDNYSWLEWSSSHVSGKGEWINSEEDQDYRTGESKTYGLHIKRSDNKPLSRREIDAISNGLGVKHYTNIGRKACVSEKLVYMSNNLNRLAAKFSPEEEQKREELVTKIADLLHKETLELGKKLSKMPKRNLEAFLEEEIFTSPDELNGLMSEADIERAVIKSAGIDKALLSKVRSEIHKILG